MEKIRTSMENASKFADWLKTRGGIALWRSIDLSDPGASCFTPAMTDGKPTTKPHWKYANEPERIITDINDVEIYNAVEVKRFHVAVRPGSGGFSLKLTDASSRRLEAAVEKAGEGAYYVFDYGDYENAVVMKPEGVVPLSTLEMAHAA